MQAMDAIYGRRAVKHYDPEHTLTGEEEKALFEAAMQSPSSFNLQHCRFVAVTDKGLRAKIREAAHDQPMVTEASLLIVMTADVMAWKKDQAKYWRNAPKPVQDILVPWIVPFYEGKPELQRDEAIRSIGIAAQTIMLTAKAMGYDSSPMIGFEADKVGELINLPDDHVVGMMIVVGKAVKSAWPKPGQLTLDEVLIRDRF